MKEAHVDLEGGRPPSLAPGQVLADRYRIVAFLGRGAVGEVYEAQDLELDEPLAVKILRPQIAGDEQVLRRFKREVQLARRVTHPNVCRVFDLVYHSGEPPQDSRVFLTMELLRGETLADRLERAGPLAPAEALPIVAQITQALEAAHANGVIHRDLKSANVILVGPPERQRAVVTDFGLAGSTTPMGSLGAGLTATGELVGSPAYMAPEQVRGEESTPATDLYALGIVLYEMVTGELPFVGKSAFYTALKRLQEPPPSPRRQAPDLDPVWDEVILRCLERNPADRFRHARHVSRALGATRAQEEATAQIHLPARRRGPHFRRRRALGVGALLLVALLGLAAIATFHRQPARQIPAEAVPERVQHPRTAVAVLRFQNLSQQGAASYLGDSLLQMLPTELAAARDLRTIPVEEIDRATKDLGLADSGSLSPATLSRLRARLSADLVITGTYLVTIDGHRTRFDLHAQDTRTGETVASFAETGSEEAFLTTLSALGERCRERLGARLLSAGEAEAVRASRPSTLAAARLYAEGLARLRRFEALPARDLLRQAVAADPDNPLLHSALGAAWSALGYDEPARLEARRAFELATPLRREDRRHIEALYREAGHEWEPAIAIYRELADYFPDNLEYGLRLATVQTTAGAPGEALATLEGLRAASTGARADPRVDLAEAEAAKAASDARRQRSAALRAEAKARTMSARSLIAQALVLQGQAALALGSPKPALETFAAAAKLYAELGDAAGSARVANYRGVALEGQGNAGGAESSYREALGLYRAIGNEYGAASELNNLAIVAIGQGHLEEGRQQLQQALAAFRETGHKAAAASAVSNLAAIADLQGDAAGARARQEEVLAIYREIGDRGAEARTLLNLGRADFAAGALAAVASNTDEALRIYRALGDRSGTALALQSQGAVLLQRGELAKAEAAFLEAHEIQRALGEKASLADCTLDLAVVALERGDPRTAEARAREALPLFQQAGLGEREAEVLAFLARVRLEQGEPGPAADLLAQARKATAATANLRFRLVLDVTAARLRAASGQTAEAVQALAAAVRQAHRAGLVPTELEARLAQGRAEIAGGRTAAGRRHLQELEADARLRGFGLIAARARSTLG
jgi:tetratricopeptide (TPR) repeat protein/TolB-like protein